MDMYGGAGPRDLPDGGKDGKKHDPLTRSWRPQPRSKSGHQWRRQHVFIRYIAAYSKSFSTSYGFSFLYISVLVKSRHSRENTT